MGCRPLSLRRLFEELGVAHERLLQLRVGHGGLTLVVQDLDLDVSAAELFFGEACPSLELLHGWSAVLGLDIRDNALSFFDFWHLS